MLIQFDVAGTPVEFRRNWFTGRAELRVHGEVIPLQSAMDLSTHISLTLAKGWWRRVADHDVVVEHVRPLLFAGFRPHAYRVFVNGELAAERRGY